jgi:hypothetical protein
VIAVDRDLRLHRSERKTGQKKKEVFHVGKYCGSSVSSPMELQGNQFLFFEIMDAFFCSCLQKIMCVFKVEKLSAKGFELPTETGLC